MYGTLTKEHFDDPQPRPLFANLVLPKQQLPSIPFIASKFGNDPGGCLLSYQQKCPHIMSSMISHVATGKCWAKV